MGLLKNGISRVMNSLDYTDNGPRDLKLRQHAHRESNIKNKRILWKYVLGTTYILGSGVLVLVGMLQATRTAKNKMQ
jgi:hypothetical protein